MVKLCKSFIIRQIRIAIPVVIQTERCPELEPTKKSKTQLPGLLQRLKSFHRGKFRVEEVWVADDFQDELFVGAAPRHRIQMEILIFHQKLYIAQAFFRKGMYWSVLHQKIFDVCLVRIKRRIYLIALAFIADSYFLGDTTGTPTR